MGCRPEPRGDQDTKSLDGSTNLVQRSDGRPKKMTSFEFWSSYEPLWYFFFNLGCPRPISKKTHICVLLNLSFKPQKSWDFNENMFFPTKIIEATKTFSRRHPPRNPPRFEKFESWQDWKWILWFTYRTYRDMNNTYRTVRGNE